MIQLSNQLNNVLRIYSAYRLLVSLILLSATISKVELFYLYIAYPQLLIASCWLYLVLNIVLMCVSVPKNKLNIFILSLLDIGILALIFTASGGIPSGIGNLLVISVAISNIILIGLSGIALAAFASCCLVYITFFFYTDLHLIHAAMLGILCFVCALFMQSLAKKIRSSTILVQTQAQDIIELEELNNQIVQRLNIGCLLIDEGYNIQLANNTAINMLGCLDYYNRYIGQFSSALVTALLQWKNQKLITKSQIKIKDSLDVQISFKQFNFGNKNNILVFLEDMSLVNNKANQLKQASLATMAGSIAHEIRNPLSSISYSAQLLENSNELNNDDRRLVAIINNHVNRINHIIESVLQITSRKDINTKQIDLVNFLHQFIGNLTLKNNQHIYLNFTDKNLQVIFDINQLTQVLTNLVQNALYFSELKNGVAKVWLNAEKNSETGLITLSVIDDGSGIEQDNLAKIFEPFFSTSQNGSGLGLYICKEFCELNEAYLTYAQSAQNGSSFIIRFKT